ncbi:MAG: PQQ-binding-like beta-propeller repeat protein [Planctomycetia bacterium]|nr:PQQ-binding-like beta-propeller repeat protein [Planctomycetia bacterium]
MAAELNAQEWCSAKPLATARVWNEVPAGVDPKQWLSIVTVGYGNQAEAYALMFDGPQGTARLIAHAPNPKGTLSGVPHWYSPFVTLLNGFRIGYGAASPSAPLPLQIEFREVVVANAAKIADKPGFGDALTVGREKIVPPLKAITLAAACSAGWSPTLSSASSQPIPARAVVEIQVLDQACRFRVTFSQEGSESVIVKERVPWEEFHEQLTALFRLPLGDKRIHDFVRLAPARVALLAANGNRLAYLVDDELAALDAATGREAWRIRIPKAPAAGAKRIEQYVVSPGANDTVRGTNGTEPRLFRWTKSLAEIAWTDGKETPLAPVAVAANWAFDVDDKSGAVTVAGARLTRYIAGKEVWGATETSPITTQPKIDGDRVVAGNERGELFALALADGKPLWRVALAGSVAGPITKAGGLRLVFSPKEETLSAIDPRDGSTKWRFAAGDRLLQPPLEHAGRVLVVTKQNRIVALDPQTGSILVETTRPTWIVGVEIVVQDGAPRPALLDLDGKAVLLGDDLKPKWEVRLASRPTGRPVVTSLPVTWTQPEKAPSAEDLVAAIAADSVQRQTFFLTTDADGFLYRLSPPGAKQR